ncbi:hypothetical protein Mpsy_0135 [Methanolobus psychrophilus R15]|nr:hypothetical protein Mpsy_0135 [Methanolobus psychrophilus R15]
MGGTLIELTTTIPKEKLVSSICKFYWDMGHKTISIYGEMQGDNNHVYYDPAYEIIDVSKCKRINVSTETEKDNKPVFDSIEITIEEAKFETKIKWSVDFELKSRWVSILFIVPFLIATYRSTVFELERESELLGGRAEGLVYFVYFLIILGISLIPWYTLVNILNKHNLKKYGSHSSIERYKTEFEELISKTEKENNIEKYRNEFEELIREKEEEIRNL